MQNILFTSNYKHQTSNFVPWYIIWTCILPATDYCFKLKTKCINIEIGLNIDYSYHACIAININITIILPDKHFANILCFYCPYYIIYIQHHSFGLILLTHKNALFLRQSRYGFEASRKCHSLLCSILSFHLGYIWRDIGKIFSRIFCAFQEK